MSALDPEQFLAALRDYRNVNDPCKECAGAGIKTYPNTATWRRSGIAGQALTEDVCDECWGSGDAVKRWPSWRAQEFRINSQRRRIDELEAEVLDFKSGLDLIEDRIANELQPNAKAAQASVIQATEALQSADAERKRQLLEIAKQSATIEVLKERIADLEQQLKQEQRLTRFQTTQLREELAEAQNGKGDFERLRQQVSEVVKVCRLCARGPYESFALEVIGALDLPPTVLDEEAKQ